MMSFYIEHNNIERKTKIRKLRILLTVFSFQAKRSEATLKKCDLKFFIDCARMYNFIRFTQF